MGDQVEMVEAVEDKELTAKEQACVKRFCEEEIESARSRWMEKAPRRADHLIKYMSETPGPWRQYDGDLVKLDGMSIGIGKNEGFYVFDFTVLDEQAGEELPVEAKIPIEPQT